MPCLRKPATKPLQSNRQTPPSPHVKTNGEPEPRRGGRPRLYDYKRPTLTFRCRGETYDLLKAAAERGDRSISEEVEARVRASFEQPALLDAIRQEIRQCLAKAKL